MNHFFSSLDTILLAAANDTMEDARYGQVHQTGARGYQMCVDKARLLTQLHGWLADEENQ